MGSSRFVAPFFGPQPIRMWPDTEAYRSVVRNPAWAIEAKVDDWRCWIQWTGSGLVSWSNTGSRLPLPPEAMRALGALDLPAGTALDGCLMGKRGGPPGYIALDVALWAGRVLDEDRDARRARLERLGIEAAERLPNGPDAYALARAMSGRVPGRVVEGVVMHRRAARYSLMRMPRKECADQIKVKAQSTLDDDGRIRAKGGAP